MDPAKIQFSGEELLLASDAALILTKNRIMKKVVRQFSALPSLFNPSLRQTRMGCLRPSLKLSHASPAESNIMNYPG
jgi:hypothetical protein